MTLAIHNHTPEMLSGAREWFQTLHNTQPENVSFCLDLHWVYRGKQDPLALLKAAGPRVADLHLRNSKNGVWMEDLGPGDMDYAVIGTALRAMSYRGMYTVELAYEGGTPRTRSLEEDLARSHDYAVKVIGAPTP